jgi:hypothetical protein
MRKVIGAAPSVAFVLLAWAPMAEASAITVTGSTLACYGAGCSNFSLNPNDPTYDLTFNGTSFTTTTDLAGDATVGIGTFDRGNINIGNPPPPSLPFTLQVSFTVPVGINGSPASFTAFIMGNAASPYDVDFDNTFQTFNYNNLVGFGSFQFGVLDVNQITNNSSGHVLTGVIQNASFSPQVVINPNAAVPEPASLVLLATGLVAVGLRLRKSTRKS